MQNVKTRGECLLAFFVSAGFPEARWDTDLAAKLRSILLQGLCHVHGQETHTVRGQLADRMREAVGQLPVDVVRREPVWDHHPAALRAPVSTPVEAQDEAGLMTAIRTARERSLECLAAEEAKLAARQQVA